MAKVLVVGSINCDISVYCDRHPAAGETVTGHDFAISLGGKGANQAVASKLCGAESHLLARVGDDSNGRDMLSRLNNRGVDTSDVRQAKEFTTGTALITVDKTGENRIVVVAGANEALDAADINHAKSSFRSADLVLVQCEIPAATVAEAVLLAAHVGTPIAINPSPVDRVSLETLQACSYIIINEIEAESLSSVAVTDAVSAQKCLDVLGRQGLGCVILTLGSDGCIYSSGDYRRHFLAPDLRAVDTTGAGDAFLGCFAAYTAGKATNQQAISRAVAFASASTQRYGAQESYLDMDQFEAFIQEFPPRVTPT